MYHPSLCQVRPHSTVRKMFGHLQVGPRRDAQATNVPILQGKTHPCGPCAPPKPRGINPKRPQVFPERHCPKGNFALHSHEPKPQ